MRALDTQGHEDPTRRRARWRALWLLSTFRSGAFHDRIGFSYNRNQQRTLQQRRRFVVGRAAHASTEAAVSVDVTQNGDGARPSETKTETLTDWLSRRS